MSGAEEGARDVDFEEALAELEEIVRALDRKEMGLDEALALFERGVERLRTATGLLDRAEGRVEELIEEAAGTLDAVELEVDAGAGDGNGSA